MTTSSADQVEPLLEQTIDVRATPDRVWALVSDLPRMSRWSPQVLRTFLRGGRPVRLGTRMVNLNRRGLLVWPTQAKVVRFEPTREIAFKIRENGTIWSFTLEPATGVDGTEVDGTRIIQRREAPEGTSDLSRKLVDRFMGGQVTFQDELRSGMRQTLARIKAEAEAVPAR